MQSLSWPLEKIIGEVEMLSTQDRVVMVSGGGRGIGRAIVDRLLSSGFRVSSGVRSSSGFTESRQALSCCYEAENEGSAEAWVETTVKRFGRVDAVINVAGIDPAVRVFDQGEDDLDRMWRVNVKGPLRVVRAAYPYLAATGQGRVVNLGSLSGKRVLSNAGYAMTKAALVSLTHAIRREGNDAGIRATIICPGSVATQMTIGKTDIEAHEMTQPEDLAVLVETLILLPNNASIAELLINCRYEPAF